jgi:DNA-directed RNA polymerase subunit K/omega
MPKSKTSTPYSGKNNVNVGSMLSNQPKINLASGKSIKQLGGAKKNKKYDSESEYGSDSDGENMSSEDESEEDGEPEEDDNNSEERNISDDDDNSDQEPDEKSEQSEEEQEDDEDSDDNKSRKSDVSDEDIYKDEEKKCYSKYANSDADDMYYDELFADDEFKMKKNVRLTKPVLFKYEKVRLLSTRAKQLAQGAKPMIKNTTGLSSKEIALLELKNKVIPLIIERPVPNSGVERWKLSELEIPEFYYN